MSTVERLLIISAALAGSGAVVTKEVQAKSPAIEALAASGLSIAQIDTFEPTPTASPLIESPTVTPVSGLNMRSFPDLNASVLRQTQSNDELLANGYIIKGTNPETSDLTQIWNQVEVGDGIQAWLRADLHSTDDQPIGKRGPNLTDIAAIQYMDWQGQLTGERLLEMSIDTSEQHGSVDLFLVANGINTLKSLEPAEILTPSHIAALDRQGKLFIQYNEFAGSELGTIFTWADYVNAQGITMIATADIAPSTYGSVLDANGIATDFRNFWYGANLPEGYVRYGSNVILNTRDTAINSANGADIYSEMLKNSIILDGESFPTSGFHFSDDKTQLIFDSGETYQLTKDEANREFKANRTESSISSDILATLPTSVLTIDGDNVIPTSVFRYETNQEGLIVGKDSEGNIIIERHPGIEMYNEDFIVQQEASLDGPIPFRVLMSAALFSEDNILAHTQDRTFRWATPLIINTAAGIRFHDSKDTNLIGSWGDGYVEQPLAPQYHGIIPQGGEDILRTTLQEVVARASQDGGDTVRLIDGSVWNVNEGIDVYVRRNMSLDEAQDLLRQNAITKGTLPVVIKVNPSSSKLEIYILQLNITGGWICQDLLQAFSLVLAPYDSEITTSYTPFGRQATNIPQWLANIFYPTDGQGAYLWPIDLGFSEQDILPNQNIPLSWVVIDNTY